MSTGSIAPCKDMWGVSTRTVIGGAGRYVQYRAGCKIHGDVGPWRSEIGTARIDLLTHRDEAEAEYRAALLRR